MRLKMTTLCAGPEGTYNPGQVVDFDESFAGALLNGGFATPVDALPLVETAAIVPPDTTVAPPADEAEVVEPDETADGVTDDTGADESGDAPKPKSKKKAG